jgi:hypothetical protein
MKQVCPGRCFPSVHFGRKSRKFLDAQRHNSCEVPLYALEEGLLFPGDF